MTNNQKRDEPQTKVERYLSLPNGLSVNCLGNSHERYVREKWERKWQKTEEEKARNRVLVVVKNGEKSLKTPDGHVIPLKEYLERKTS